MKLFKKMIIYPDYKPKLSIILPAFNRAEHITAAIDSVITQNYSDWELVICDDGSTDVTFSRIKKFVLEFSNIRYLFHKNRRLPLTLNTGILASAGNYITFLGSDDKYLANHLKFRMDIFDAEPELDLIYGGIEISGNPFVKDKNDLTKQIHLNNCVVGGTFFIKKEAALKIEGFRNISYSEDSDFFERITSFARIRKVNFPTYFYNRNVSDSITNNI